MSLRLLVSCVLAACLLGSPALAHWQWTRWGMSADQVTAASKGGARRTVGTDRQRVHGFWLHVTGDTVERGFPVLGEYYFDRSGSQLKLVRLSLKDFAQCPALEADLRRQYGVPVEDSMQVTPDVTIKALSWSGQGDFVALTVMPKLGDMEPLCFVRYMEKAPVVGP